MAMAMASAAGITGTRIRSAHAAVCASSSAVASGSSSFVHLCSSFTGLSLQTSGSGRLVLGGGDSSFSISAPAKRAPATRKPFYFTVSKLRSHKASAKRFKVTASGKIMRRQAGKQHLLRKKSANRKRRLCKMKQVNRSDYDNVIGALPYLKVKGREA